jgi:hypothetical protein
MSLATATGLWRMSATDLPEAIRTGQAADDLVAYRTGGRGTWIRPSRPNGGVDA